MIRTYKVLLVVGLTIFGIWGCGKSGTAEGSPAARIAKLEEELKAATAARDTFRQRLADSEKRTQDGLARYEAVVRERDDLQGKLARKVDEHKELQVQYDGFRKNLKELIGQAEVALAPKPATPAAVGTLIVTPVSLTKGEGK
ncbi:MAG: hypothetical protein KF873_09910 [Gemmataceae bacterium]|nr:hypothetical protein [Planctomycetia bacterium]MBX3399046.1 hypothetical protein [Gemmataceae bacterium]